MHGGGVGGVGGGGGHSGGGHHGGHGGGHHGGHGGGHYGHGHHGAATWRSNAVVFSLAGQVRLARERGDGTREAEALDRIDGIVAANTFSESGVHGLTAVVELSRELGDAAREVTALNWLALAHVRAGRHAEAAEAYQAVVRAAVGLEDRALEAAALDGLAGLRRRAFVESADAATRAAELWRELGEPARQAGSLVRLADLRREQKDFGSALAVYHQALDLTRETEDQAVAGRAWRGTANALIGLDRFKEAVESYDQAGPAGSGEPGDITWARWAAVSIEPLALAAAGYTRTGERAQAAATWSDIAQAIQEHRQTSTCTCQHRVAADACARALALWRELGDPVREAETLTGLGDALSPIWGRGQEASEAYMAAADLWRELGDRVRHAEARTRLASWLMRSARPTEAFEAYAVAAAAWHELGDRRRQAEVLMAIGRGHHAHRDSPSAVTAFAAAAELWRELGDRPREAEALMCQGREHGRGPDAVAAYTQAGTIYRKLWRPADWARARRARRRAAS